MPGSGRARTARRTTRPVSAAAAARTGWGSLAALGILAGAAVAAFALHLGMGSRFPPPWVDESHFLLPALDLARHGSLAVPTLNAPDGIFWMPHGYYVLLGGVFALLPASLEVARLVSFLALAGAAAALAVAGRHLGVHPLLAAVIAGAWLLTPRMVLTGNIARMEAVVLLLSMLALALASSDRWPAAIAISFLAPVVHPVGVAATFAVVGTALIFRIDLRPRRTIDVALAAGAVAAVLAEGAYLLANLEVAREHVGFQLDRKREYSLAFAEVRALTLPWLLAAIATVLKARNALGDRAAAVTAMLMLALTLAAAGAFGQEMWYGAYVGETTLALTAIAVLAVVAAVRSRATPRRGQRSAWTRTVTAVVLVAVLAATTWWWRNPETEGLHWDDVAADEWQRFVASASDGLRELDAELDRPAIVGVDRFSPATFTLAAQEWRHLRFAQVTPVTDFSVMTADGRPVELWMLNVVRTYTPSPPPWVGEPVLARSSPRGTYGMVIFRVARNP